MAIYRGSGSSLTGSAVDPTNSIQDTDFGANGLMVRTAAGVYSTTPDNTSNWDTAYTWGDWSVGVDKTFVDNLNVDADTLDGQQGTWYLDRTNHTGTQLLSTISDSGTAAAADLTTSAMDTTAGRATKVGDYGAGKLLDLRTSTPAANGPPSDWTGRGTVHGFANGGTDAGTGGLQIPELPSSFAWGSLTINAQWDSLGDQNSAYAVNRVFTRDNRQWVSHAIDASTWSGWVEMYSRANILGTVSQSSGVPTGAIIEQGSNSNGEYFKLANGWAFATNGNAAITTSPMTFVGTITKIDGDKLWIGRWY